ncbi:MAG: nucleotidyltransferase family protein [Alphaproteobacteria bacterium]|nr:nucleotidyltransferase family protein [Alphaproteobacteria bacterium]
MIDQAMILAAGFGKRMYPLTEVTPKPLLVFKGRPIIDWSIEKLVKFGVKKIVINGYHLKDQIERFIHEKEKQYPLVQFIFSEENEILETGGGVEKALSYFNEKPFFVVNGDSYWESDTCVFSQLNCAWDKNKSTTLMVCPLENVNCCVKNGDYYFNSDRTISRFDVRKNKQYIGVNISATNFYKYKPHTKRCFTLRDIWDEIEKEAKLFGEEFNGKWYHLSTPEDLETC